MSTTLFIAGLTAIVAAVWGLAGVFWALMVAGALLIALGVLTELHPNLTRREASK